MRNMVINVSRQLDSGLQACEELSKRELHLINFKYIFYRLLPLGDSFGFYSCIIVRRPLHGVLHLNTPGLSWHTPTMSVKLLGFEKEGFSLCDIRLLFTAWLSIRSDMMPFTYRVPKWWCVDRNIKWRLGATWLSHQAFLISVFQPESWT